MDLATLDKYINFISLLADGINPVTNEKCKDGEILCNPEVIRTLFKLRDFLQDIYDRIDVEYKIIYQNQTIYTSDDFADIKNTIHYINEGWKSQHPFIWDVCLDDYGIEKVYLSGSGSLHIYAVATCENKILSIPIDRPVRDKRRFKITYRKVLEKKEGLSKSCQYISSSRIVENYMPEDLFSPEAKERAEDLVKALGEYNREKYVFEEIIVR